MKPIDFSPPLVMTAALFVLCVGVPETMSGSSLHHPDSPSPSSSSSANEAPGHRLRPIGGGAGVGGGRSAWSAFWKSRIMGAPYFSNETETRVLVSRGQTCYLHCLVGNLGDRQVSWIRSRDLRILSIGEMRYTRDSRFTPLHDAGNDVWALKITDAERADSGEYECQVSYHDDIEKELKMRVSLVVLDSRAHISGSVERHVNEGSRLSLVCRIESPSAPPSYVYWYRDGDVVNYSNKEGVKIRTLDPSTASRRRKGRERKKKPSSSPSSSNAVAAAAAAADSIPAVMAVSTLDIVNVTAADAGIYTCAPSNARNHSVVVHVVKGENLAMQRKNEAELPVVASANAAAAAAGIASTLPATKAFAATFIAFLGRLRR